MADASLSLAGEQKVSLHGQRSINCKAESGVQALGGEGQFSDATSGTATLTLHNCKETAVNSSCTSSGEAAGTIKTEALRFRLAYLSDGNRASSSCPTPKAGCSRRPTAVAAW